MTNILSKIFGGGEPSSSSIAKERLQLVLIHDRSNLTPEQVQAMKDEILEVIARYVEFDRDTVHIDLIAEERDSVLTAEIPIMPGNNRRRRSSASTS